jgi:orotate phosphoribosyltransferase
MTDPILNSLPARQGHFRLESGYHTDTWLTLDALFVTPRNLAPLVTELADRLRPHTANAICGPLLGGAFLAQAVATALEIDFYFAEPEPRATGAGLFDARYRLPPELRRRVAGARVAVVDDVISAGSSVRAAAEALADAGATTVAIGTILLVGTVARDHFTRLRIPLEALGQRDLALWQPAECPRCRAGIPLEDS